MVAHNRAAAGGPDTIRTLACPGIGVYEGCPHVREAAQQMAAAHADVVASLCAGSTSGAEARAESETPSEVS